MTTHTNITTALTSLINLSNEVLSAIQSKDFDVVQLNDAQVLRNIQLKEFFNQHNSAELSSKLDEMSIRKLNELKKLDEEIISAMHVKKDTLSKQIIIQKKNKKATNIYNKNQK